MYVLETPARSEALLAMTVRRAIWTEHFCRFPNVKDAILFSLWWIIEQSEQHHMPCSGAASCPWSIFGVSSNYELWNEFIRFSQQPSAPFAPGRQFSSNPWHDDENSPRHELGLNRRPSAGHSTTNSVDHWSGGFSQWGQSLRPYPKGPTFPWYRGHPGGLSRVPGTRKGSFHPQRSGSQTLGLQCAPPTPPNTQPGCHICIWSLQHCSRMYRNK